VRYEQWLKQIVVGVVETNQLSAPNAKTLYEKILKKIFGEKGKNNERKN
jgi:hypothetical protein